MTIIEQIRAELAKDRAAFMRIYEIGNCGVHMFGDPDRMARIAADRVTALDLLPQELPDGE